MASKSLIFDIIGRDRGAAAAVNKVSNQLLGVGAIGGAAFGAAIMAAADFDAQMSLVQDGTRASAAELGLLRDAALDAGARTKFSATESAAAIDALGRAGVSTGDILDGGLNGALDLAAAGNLDVAKAAEIASTAMVQFGLSGRDVPHIADLLAAGAGKAMGSVDDLSQALNQSGLIASQTGLTIEETTGGLAAFASAGLLGSDGGTAFKTMLQRLNPTSAEAKAKMDELGLSAYDAQGNFIGLEAFAGQLHDRMAQLTPQARSAAMSIIFGSDAVRAASVLYEQGAEGIGTWIDQTNDAGYAAESAKIQMDNLKGDLEQFGGAFETAMIQQGSGANDVLRTLTQTATGLVSGFAGLPEPVQGTITVLGGLAVGGALVTGAMLKIIPAIDQTRAAMRRLDVSGVSLGRRLGKGVGLTGILVGLSAAAAGANSSTELTADKLARLQSAFKAGSLNDLINELDFADAGANELRTTLERFYSGDFFTSGRSGQGLTSVIDSISFGLTDLDAAYTDNQARFTEWGRQLSSVAETDLKTASKHYRDLVKAAGDDDEARRLALRAMPDYEAALRALAAQQGVTLDEQELFNLATGKGALATQLMRDQAAGAQVSLGGMGREAGVAGEQIAVLADQIRDFGKTQLDANSAQREFESAVDEAAATLERQKTAYEEANGSLEGFVPNLDIGTEAGREAAASLDEIARAANESAAAILENTGSQDESTAALDRGRQALIDQLGQYGITGEAADIYIGKLLATPAEVRTNVTLIGIAAATAAANTLRDTINSIPDYKGVSVETIVGNPSMGFINPERRAGGGAILGPGPKGIDSVYLLGAPGEHMLTAADVDAMGGQDAVYAFRRRLHDRTAADIAASGNTARSGIPSPSVGFGGRARRESITVVLESRGGIDLTQYITARIVEHDEAADRRIRMG